MRFIVCGGRDYQDSAVVYDALDKLHASKGITLIIHGACCNKHDHTDLTGADPRAGRHVPTKGLGISERQEEIANTSSSPSSSTRSVFDRREAGDNRGLYWGRRGV